MTKAETRKYNKLTYLTTKGDAAKRDVMKRKIEAQKAKIAAMQAKIEEAKKKLALENAKGRQMVEEYNYFVERTMNEHLIDLNDLKAKIDAEKTAENTEEQVKAANADRAEAKDIISPQTPENGQKEAKKPARDTQPTDDHKNENTGKKQAHMDLLEPLTNTVDAKNAPAIPQELTSEDIDAIFGDDGKNDDFIDSLNDVADLADLAETAHIAQKNDVSALTHDKPKTSKKATKTPEKKKSIIDIMKERAAQHEKEQKRNS